MTINERRQRSRWALRLGLVALLVLPSALTGQQERVQIAGSNLFSDGAVHMLFGADEAIDIGGSECVPGGPPCEVPEWTFLAGAHGGLAVTEDIPLSIYAHLGIERKLTSELSLALLGFGFVQPLQGGAALRFDAMDVGALKAGYGWGEEEGVLIGVELAWEFILDLFR